MSVAQGVIGVVGAIVVVRYVGWFCVRVGATIIDVVGRTIRNDWSV
jgi:hypothetical protein